MPATTTSCSPSTLSAATTRASSFDGRRWCIEDSGSANGTTVDGQPLPPGSPRPLRHGDRVGTGTETLVFSWPGGLGVPEQLRGALGEAVGAKVTFRLGVFGPNR